MQEDTILQSSGAIPGIPGIHGPGYVRIDWDARTVTPLDVVAPTETPVVEAVQEPAAPEQPATTSFTYQNGG